MRGTNTFTYASDMVSTVSGCSSLMLDGMSFSYAPPVNNRDLFALQDQSSLLVLNGCTLSSTTTGMRLTSGQLIVNDNNTLINTGASATSEGFAFGNGIAADDLTIIVNPGASLNLLDGVLDYQNVN